MSNNGFYYFSDTQIIYSNTGYEATFDFTNLTNPRTYTFLDLSGTIVLLGSNELISNTYINWGSPGQLGNISPNTVAATTVTATVTDTGTVNIPIVATISHRTSGTPAAGFGESLLFNGDSDNRTLREMSSLEADWITATDGSRVSRIALYIYSAVLGKRTVFVTTGPNGNITFGPILASSFQLSHGSPNDNSITLNADSSSAWDLRNGSSNTILNIYNTFTSTTNYERLTIGSSANQFLIRPAIGSGGGTLRSIAIDVFDANVGSISNSIIFSHTLTTSNSATNNIGADYITKVADSTSTSGSGVQVSRIRSLLPIATHLSRTGQSIWSVNDVLSERDVLAIGANGSAATFAAFGGTQVIQQTYGATITNNVVSSGTTNQLDDFTSLSVYATDAQAIHNDIYQLGRAVKLILDGLRNYNWFT